MHNLSQDKIDKLAARIIAIFKEGQSWDDTNDLEKSYVTGVVEGLASDIYLTANEAAIRAAYNCGFDAGFKAARGKDGVVVTEYKAADPVDPPVGGPTAA